MPKKMTSASTITIDSVKDSLCLTSLPKDLQVNVLGFLPEKDVQCMQQVNRHLWQLLHQENAGLYAWKSLAEHRWPFLVSCQDYTLEAPLHMSRILCLMAKDTPTHIDQSLFTDPNLESTNRGKYGTAMVQYSGRIGQTSRSVRANAPFPRPVFGTRKPKHVVSSLCQRLCRPRRAQATAPLLQPFVVPYRVPQQGCFSLAPRSIAYYEVNILPRPNAMSPSSSVSGTECIAVGLSTHNFGLGKKMPGWDAYSFGYHSDDGTSFFNKIATKQYGPCFGVGDVVGCGIDYQAQAVFYTLNGRFLGYVGSHHAVSMDPEWMQKDWLPTVGLDTQALVECNFGTEQPFVYDLSSMVKMARHKGPKASMLPHKTKHS